MMIHDNAVRQVDNETAVCQITNPFCSLFHRLCYENKGRNSSWKV